MASIVVRLQRALLVGVPINWDLEVISWDFGHRKFGVITKTLR